MRCQLARVVKLRTSKHKYLLSWLVWVAEEKPRMKPAIGYFSRRPRAPEMRFRSPYFCPTDNLPVTIEAWTVELLPYFAEIPRTSYEDLVARGGERMPEETELN